MYLNKKGLTLVEIIVSVALISVVMIFMYKLLTEINDELTNTKFAINNQSNRLEIIKYVEKDLNVNDKKLQSIELKTNLQTIEFTFSKNNVTYESSLKILFENNKNYVTYTDINSVTTKWEIKNATINGINSNNIKSKVIEPDTLATEIIIPIYTINELNNEAVNNPIDDLVFSYIGSDYEIIIDSIN